MTTNVKGWTSKILRALTGIVFLALTSARMMDRVQAQDSPVQQISTAPFSGNANKASMTSAPPTLERPTYAAVPATKEARAQEKYKKAELEELKGYLREAHEGKRGDDERYFILHTMLQDYGMIKSTGTPECRAALEEWQELLKAHPEFIAHPPPLELHEQREARRQEEVVAAQAKFKLATWTPKDATGWVYGQGDRAIIVYQYRVEVFNLPEEYRLVTSSDFQRVADAASQGLLKPNKTLTFRHPVYTGLVLPDLQPFDHPIWICESMASNYAAYDDDERRVIGFRRHWVNSRGKYEDFCGAISIDGDILYKLPVSQHYPDQLLEILQTTPDGRRAAIGLGKSVTDEEDEVEEVGQYQKVFIWEVPNGLETVDTSNRADAAKALQKHGLNPAVLGR